MAFYETHLGYVGLGSMEVYRTAEQAAADLVKFGHDIDIPKNAGLLAKQSVMAYAVSRGRLVDLQVEVTRLESELARVQKIIEDRVRELMGLGVMKPQDIAIKLGTMGIAKLIPGIGWLMGGLELIGIDVFGSKGKKKKKSEEIMRHLEALAKEAEFFAGRLEKLNEEGRQLTAAVEQGESAISVTFVQHEKQTKKSLEQVTAAGDGKAATYYLKRTVSDKKDPYLASADELAKRTTITPTGARLPEGFQMIYSPVLRDKAIVTQTDAPKAAPDIVTGKKLVYGGLADLPLSDKIMPMIPAALAIGGMYLFLRMLMDIDKEPQRIRQVAVPRRRW